MTMTRSTNYDQADPDRTRALALLKTLLVLRKRITRLPRQRVRWAKLAKKRTWDPISRVTVTTKVQEVTTVPQLEAIS